MKNVVAVYKSVGKTPLECIYLFKRQFPEYQNQKIAYAGRLDPMAEGVLLLLIGDECKKRTSYQLLPKTYECHMLLGLTSDTYDVLGKVELTNPLQTPGTNALKSVVKDFTGSFEQSYPPYSSVRVNGKPLFYWARENKLDKVSIPKKKVTLPEISIENVKTHSLHDISEEAIQRIKLVNGNFRQKEIIKSWEHLRAQNKINVTSVHLKISCSSGTYIRSLVHNIGERLKTGAIVFSLKRTTVGPFQLNDAIRLASPV